MAEVHSVLIPLNNLQLLVAATHDSQSGLRDQISWFCKQFEVMLGFLLMYYPEEGNNISDDTRWFVENVTDFAAEYGDVMVDAFEIMYAEQHTTSTANSTKEEQGDDESPAAVIGPEARKLLRFNENMYAEQDTTSSTNSTREDQGDDESLAAVIGPDAVKLIKIFVSLTWTGNSQEYYRTVCKKAAEESMQMQIRPIQRRHWVMDGTDILGFEFYRCLMERRLLEEYGTEQLNVIAITGEGGTGKTTLAKILYRGFKNCIDIECCGWISVSKAYVLRDLLLSILNDIMIIAEEIYEMEEWELKQQLRKQLSGRRYLIVIDDVWDTQAWDELKDIFPINSNYSRILITTRFPSVASYATRPGRKPCFLPDDVFRNEIYDASIKGQYYDDGFELKGIWQCDCFKLKPLNEDDSWVLFRGLYFGGRCPYPKLRVPGRRIVRSCRGRLLVLSVVARILRATDRADDGSNWSGIASRINNELSGDYNQQMDILTLCFDKLPQQLQSCFLYLGVFPEDTEISAKQLIQLWIAEGLIGLPEPQENNANCTMEDVGKCYLEELIGLGLIQISTSRSEGGAKSCYIHDILRDFCIHLSKERKFLEVHTGGDHVSTNADQTKPKKLSILANCREYLSKSKNSSGSCSPVRSFSSFSQDTQSFSKEDWKSFFEHFRLLRVLNLGKQEAQNKLDDSIGDLFHLRYLNIKPAKNITVSSSIFNLWNLQTIDLRKASFPKLPEGLWKMQQLRHLYLGGRSRLPKAENEDHLPNLLTLSYVSNDPRGATRIAEKAPNLRKLGLHGYCCASQEEQKATFNLQHLQSLKFAKQCTFKEAITLPATITKLTVKGALLQPNAIKMFGELPNLQTLKLVRTNFENDELKVLGKDPFPRLQLLKLVNSAIVSWKLEKGAMPMLRHLVISCCFQLPEIPTEICKDSALLKLELFWPSTELANKLAKELEEAKKSFELVIYPPLSEFSELLLSAGRRYRDLLDINPTELKFPFELYKRSSRSVQLANNTNQFVAFNVQTSHPMRYSYYPEEGIILPGSTCDVSIIMRAHKKAPSDLEKSWFLVQSVVIPHRPTRRGVTLDMFNKEAGKVVEEFKLHVVCVPTDPPSVVHEESSPRASVLNKEKLLTAGMRHRDLLDINPTELKFPFVLYKESSCPMQLANNTNQFVAFKVLLTNSYNYFVSPSSGIVLPGSTIDVVVKMRAKVKAPSNMKSNDRFLVKSVVAPHGATHKDITSDMFDKEAGEVVEEYKLSVIYVPTNPLSPTASVLEKEKLVSAGTRVRYLLDINPTELKFPFELNKQSSCSMQLANKTNQFVAFTVQVSNPNNYSVSASSAIVWPRSTFDIIVTMRAQVKDLSNMKCNDSFLVVSEMAPCKEITSDILDAEAGEVVENFKLSVIHVPPNPLSPVPEESSSGASVPVRGNPNNVLT